jgi:mRNA interferase HigB
VHVISRRRLQEFWSEHPQAREPLLAWHRVMTTTTFVSLGALRLTFPAADLVRHWIVFNVGGNNVRLVTAIKFDRRQNVYVRHVFTHAEYDRWNDTRRDDEAKEYQAALKKRTGTRSTVRKKGRAKRTRRGEA